MAGEAMREAIDIPAVNGTVEPFVNDAGTITLSEWLDGDDDVDLVVTADQARQLAARLEVLAAQAERMTKAVA